MTIDQRALNAIVQRIFATPDFYIRHWDRRPVLIRGAAMECAGVYDVDAFLSDLESVQTPPFVAAGIRDGRRSYLKLPTSAALLSAVREGGVASLKLSRHWHAPRFPSHWRWMRALFGALCRASCMVYLSPQRSEDVDLFLAGPRSALGAHFDSTHVVTLQLFGERLWTVEEQAPVDNRLAAIRARDYASTDEAAFCAPAKQFKLSAGDALYVPPYAVHRVTGVGWSVALSLGLRAFNEIDVAATAFDAVAIATSDRLPALSLPASQGEAHFGAKIEFARQIRILIATIEEAAVDLANGPLRLPETFEPFPPYRQGAPVGSASSITARSCAHRSSE